MKLKPCEKWVCEVQPLMRVANRIEFQQRLQWLSEGMLHAHIEPRSEHDVSDIEKRDYSVFNTLRTYETTRRTNQ